MVRLLRAGVAVVLLGSGVAGSVVFLADQGLDRAEKWISIVGVMVSVTVSVAGVVLGWLTWRQGHAAGPDRPSEVDDSPGDERSVNAGGPAAVAIGGENRGEVNTEVSNDPPTRSVGGPGISASGAGSVAIGGGNAGLIRTRVTGHSGDRPA